MTLLQRFLKTEAASGVVLFFAMVAALLWSNSPWTESYVNLFNTPMIFQLGDWQSTHPLVFWINEGLMTLFFLLIGLELKKEILEGKLRSFAQVMLPGLAALGGMLVPAFIYVLVNINHPETLKGWPIPVATDIAFALGVISLFGRRVPLELKLFLMALAIFDDLGAIVIIAFYHSDQLAYFNLFIALVLWLALMGLNYRGAKNIAVYFVIGLGVWFFIFRSGVHPTIAGVLVAMSIPLAPAKKLEESIHPWVSYLIMPLFALANAGISFSQVSIGFIFEPVILGIILGLVIGKQLGVFGFTYFIVKKGWASLPKGTDWYQLYGVAILCGIGFTMSLFLGNLAFEASDTQYLVQVRLGVFLGSILSGMLGAFILSRALKSKGGRFEASSR